MNKDMPLILNNNHAIGVITLTLLTHTFHFQIEVFFGVKQQETLQNSIQHKKGTGTYIYTDCYSILTYPALRCNLDV